MTNKGSRAVSEGKVINLKTFKLMCSNSAKRQNWVEGLTTKPPKVTQQKINFHKF